jgi:Tfp pilus assembly protein FimV
MAQVFTANHVIAAPVAALSRSAHVRPAPTVATYRRRRLMVLLAAVATAFLLVPAASRAAAAFRDVPASVSERRPVPAHGLAPVLGGYMVQPGDTLWSIARRLQPAGDVRPLVHQLIALNGGASLGIGQRLAIP